MGPPSSWVRGRLAESLVEAELARRGFDILARNLRDGPLELDLVARRDALVVVVEVRARGATSFAPPFASITWKKKRFLLRAANRLWTKHVAKMAGVERFRIDVASVTFGAGSAVVDILEGAITFDH
ncbi:MAG: YraN family protein [Polyangiaceae bacterium]